VIRNDKEIEDMTETAEQLKAQLSQLSTQERAELAHFLIHSLDEGVDADAEAAWDAELARRMEEIRSGKAVGEPADKVFAELRKKYS
jgi:putative addiction module component (TIGR02574 family)